MAQKDNMLTAKLVMRGGKLKYKDGEKNKYDLFVQGLEEGQEVELFFDANKDDGSNAQLAKIHASIRKLANEMGYTFSEMKYEIKCKAGLCWENSVGEEECKSFGKCSKEELSSVIETLNEVGSLVNISFD